MLTLALALLSAAVVLLLTGARPPAAVLEEGAGAGGALGVEAQLVDPEGDEGAGSPWRRAVRAVRRRIGGRRAQAVELQVLDDVSAALDAGLPVGRSVLLALEHLPEEARRDDRAWAVLARAAQEGQALAPAWSRLARTTSSPTITVVARAWQVAALTGAPLAGALRMSAHAARERQRLERALESATAGARATATVLTLLPAAGVALAAVLGVPPTSLYGTPLAWASLGAGALLLLGGQVMVRRLVGRVLESLR